jgi:hypothetical protein
VTKAMTVAVTMTVTMTMTEGIIMALMRPVQAAVLAEAFAMTTGFGLDTGTHQIRTTAVEATLALSTTKHHPQENGIMRIPAGGNITTLQ